MNKTDNVSIYGRLQIIEKCKITNTETTILDDTNRIMRTGFQTFLSGVVDRDQYRYGFEGIYIGDDIGEGTLDEPAYPSDVMTAQDQNVVYRIPDASIFQSFPQPNILSFTAIIDGNDVLRETGIERNIITSATIRNVGGDIVAYRRFGGRATSPLITLNVIWTLTIAPQCDDEPSSYVRDVSFFVMKSLDTTTSNMNSVSPEELTHGNGEYAQQVNLGDETEIYVMAIMESDTGILTAYEWDNTTTVNIGGELTQQKTHKPYIIKLKVKKNEVSSSLEVCADGVCGKLYINREPKMDQYWHRMKPVGYHLPNTYKGVKYWQFKKTGGAFVGAPTISDTSPTATRILWNYTTIEEQITLENATKTHMEIIHCDDAPNHVSMAMDNEMTPVLVYEVNGEIYLKTSADNGFNKIDDGISPFVINMDVFEFTQDVILVYVDHNVGEIIWRSSADQYATRNIVSTPYIVTDILTTGLTNDRSMKICYSHTVDGVPAISNVCSVPLGVRLDHTVSLTII